MASTSMAWGVGEGAPCPNILNVAPTAGAAATLSMILAERFVVEGDALLLPGEGADFSPEERRCWLHAIGTSGSAEAACWPQLEHCSLFARAGLGVGSILVGAGSRGRRTSPSGSRPAAR
jgi:hypothetical protein